MDSYEEFNAKMKQLEKLFQSDPDKALKGMIDFYPEASKTTYHDIGDSIGLWMQNEMTETAREYLSQKAEATEDPTLANTYRTWLSWRKDSGEK